VRNRYLLSVGGGPFQLRVIAESNKCLAEKAFVALDLIVVDARRCAGDCGYFRRTGAKNKRGELWLVRLVLLAAHCIGAGV